MQFNSCLSDTTFKDNLSSSHGGSLEIMLTVPLKKIILETYHFVSAYYV